MVLHDGGYERQAKSHSGRIALIDGVVAFRREMGLRAAPADLLAHSDAVVLDLQDRPTILAARPQNDAASPGSGRDQRLAPLWRLQGFLTSGRLAQAASHLKGCIAGIKNQVFDRLL